MGRAEVVGLALVLLCFPIIVSSAVSACPWGRDPKLTELRAACLCATNVAQQLSIQVSLYSVHTQPFIIIVNMDLDTCNVG